MCMCVVYGFCIVACSHETLICFFNGGLINFRTMEHLNFKSGKPCTYVTWASRRRAFGVIYPQCLNHLLYRLNPPFLKEFVIYINMIPTIHSIPIKEWQGFYLAIKHIVSTSLNGKEPQPERAEDRNLVNFVLEMTVHPTNMWPFPLSVQCIFPYNRRLRLLVTLSYPSETTRISAKCCA